MKIKRRLFNKETGKVKTVTETVELIKKLNKTFLVKLKNGDIIKRKQKDIVDE